MHPFINLERKVLALFRMDLQLHFFWGFTLTLMAVFWNPLIFSGLVITVIKEWLDYIADKGWSWGDFWFGLTGSCTGVLFLAYLQHSAVYAFIGQ